MTITSDDTRADVAATTRVRGRWIDRWGPEDEQPFGHGFRRRQMCDNGASQAVLAIFRDELNKVIDDALGEEINRLVED